MTKVTAGSSIDIFLLFTFILTPFYHVVHVHVSEAMPSLFRWKTAKFLIFFLIAMILVGILLQAGSHKQPTGTFSVSSGILEVEEGGQEEERQEESGLTDGQAHNGGQQQVKRFKIEPIRLPRIPDSDTPLTNTPKQSSKHITSKETSPRSQKRSDDGKTPFMRQFDAGEINDSFNVQPIQQQSDSMTSDLRHFRHSHTNEKADEKGLIQFHQRSDANYFNNNNNNNNDNDDIKINYDNYVHDKDNDNNNNSYKNTNNENNDKNTYNNDKENNVPAAAPPPPLPLPQADANFTAVRLRFEERNARIQRVCNAERGKLHGLYGKGRSFHLARGRLSVCLVPKVGTTYITYTLRKKIMFKSGVENVIDFDFEHDRKRFFVVREPYGRLVSAYFSKVVSHPKWWTSLGRFIVQKIRRNPSEKSARCGHDVTFPEFIRYFITAQALNKFKNNHFIPVHELCNPCFAVQQDFGKFDFVAHLETMKDDMTYILDSVNVTTDDDFRFDPVRTIVGHFMNSRDERHERCGSPWCPTFQRLWWALQSNGHVLSSIPLPLSGGDCDAVSPDEMIDIAVKAAEESRGIIDKASQKRDAVAELYAQVSLEDRILVRSALMTDFNLFGYDPQPDFVFTSEEMKQLKKQN